MWQTGNFIFDGSVYRMMKTLLLFIMQVGNFISDIGGQLGLWAGFSVLSVLELVELILLLCTTRDKNKTAACDDSKSEEDQTK